ncbi:zinc-containing alcohol dehydrogenase superfamily protein [Thecamonas trahens ATCC 50062]|uniref:Zinc-containing alcohol dehydrogenase superfamily protein n=1 Tax=Thecamonas trahens ATCC 50062 TaxID=461836 RepID=A0A0L0D991_THETB|nr:zinc-containing alcohol dehydrogenase superfamily protein [Thecamonas trahens ATCC 50062]KNC47873.1 zinc-containing alcohol dehydrogenase superfamily protein [Thecamonas trahens ATCC 50062]|eukprot:XP_013759351.1 zinc-containing alcohol dehydrogenase superfamily protein [Thecamonas trahens ATCC 50062]
MAAAGAGSGGAAASAPAGYPQTMRLVRSPPFGEPSVMTPVIDEVAALKAGTVLIKTAFAGVNRADTLQRKGKYAPPKGESNVLGLEVAGEIVAINSNGAESSWSVGDRVCSLLGSGGYAEYVAAPLELLIPVPEDVPMEEAGGFPEAFLTAFQAVSYIGKLGAGETLLIHGGASGVGTAAIQLAKLLGANVIVTASTADKLATCSSLGADVAINYKDTDFVEEVKAATDGRGVDLVVDYVGSAYFSRNLEALALDGRMVMLGFLSGAVVDAPLSLAPILRKRLTITGSTLRTRPMAYKAELVAGLIALAGDAWANRSLKVIVDSVYALDDVADAHSHMEANANIGKIVLRP